MFARPLGPIVVYVIREEVSKFANSLGLPSASRATEETSVPWTYPVRFLSHPAVRDAILDALGPNNPPIQEAVEICYIDCGLAIGTALLMHGDIQIGDAEDRLRIRIQLSLETPDRKPVVRLVTRILGSNTL
jgi:hypothetical protein